MTLAIHVVMIWAVFTGSFVRKLRSHGRIVMDRSSYISSCPSLRHVFFAETKQEVAIGMSCIITPDTKYNNPHYILIMPHIINNPHIYHRW